jgi:hypothetical protein
MLVYFYLIYLVFVLRRHISNQLITDGLQGVVIILKIYIKILDILKIIECKMRKEGLQQNIKKVGNVNIYEYEIKNDNEINKFKTFNKKLNKIEKKQLEKINKMKNKILHMSLINKEMEILIELTNEIKEFSYHFDKKNSFNLDLFLEYIKKMKNIEIDYMNNYLLIHDEELNELKIELNNIKNTNINEILNIKEE